MDIDMYIWILAPPLIYEVRRAEILPKKYELQRIYTPYIYLLVSSKKNVKCLLEPKHKAAFLSLCSLNPVVLPTIFGSLSSLYVETTNKKWKRNENNFLSANTGKVIALGALSTSRKPTASKFLCFLQNPMMVDFKFDIFPRLLGIRTWNFW